MGYSLSQEQYEKLQRLTKEGRRCAMATYGRSRGGCFNRATVVVVTDDWNYPESMDAGNPPDRVDSRSTFCLPHGRSLLRSGLANSKIKSARRF